MHAAKRARIDAAGSAAASSATLPAALNAPVAAMASAPSAAPAHRFLSHVLLLATAQLTREAGFSHTRASNLQILGELLSKYIESIGVTAGGIAAQAGRSEVNAHDMLQSLSEMGLDFAEMKQWAELSEPAPAFAHCIPPFPIPQPVILVEPATTGAGQGSAQAAAGSSASGVFPPRPPHIPLCLPAFPPKRTYTFTPDVKSAARDEAEAATATAAASTAAGAAAKPGAGDAGSSAAALRRRKVEENRKLERALVTLHQAAVKAGLEQAQRLAQQELNLQERILREEPRGPHTFGQSLPAAAAAAPAVAARPAAATAAAPQPSVSPPAAAVAASAASAVAPTAAASDASPAAQSSSSTLPASAAPPATAASASSEVAAMDESADVTVKQEAAPDSTVADAAHGGAHAIKQEEPHAAPSANRPA